MARINIDSKFFGDGRVKLLARKLNEHIFTTHGRLLAVWRHCYDHVDSCISPEIVAAVSESDDFAKFMVETGLAKLEGECLLICGVSERVQYLKSAQERGREGGKKSAETRKEKYGSAQPQSEGSPKGLLREPSRVRFEATEASSSSSSSVSDMSTYPPASGDADKTITLLDIWNQHCGNLPKVKALNEERRRKIKTRLKENSDLEYWADVAKALAANPFCNGDNKSGWIANFDFFIKPGTHLKAAEGSYMPKRANPEKKPIVFSESLRS